MRLVIERFEKTRDKCFSLSIILERHHYDVDINIIEHEGGIRSFTIHPEAAANDLLTNCRPLLKPFGAFFWAAAKGNSFSFPLTIDEPSSRDSVPPRPTSTKDSGKKDEGRPQQT